MFHIHVYFSFLVFLFPKDCDELNTDGDEPTSLERFHVMPVTSFCFTEE